MSDRPCENPTRFANQLRSTLLLMGDGEVDNDRIRDLMPCGDSDEDCAVIEVLHALHLVDATKDGGRLYRTTAGDQAAARIRDDITAEE